MTISTEIKEQGFVILTNALDQGTQTETHAVSIDYQWPNGTGLSKADAVWSDTRSLGVGTELLDLTALVQLDAAAKTIRTVNLDKVKYIRIKNTTTAATTGYLEIGAGGANPWIGALWKAADDTTTVPFLSVLEWGDPSGVAVVAGTGMTINVQAFTATQTYEILIIGESA